MLEQRSGSPFKGPAVWIVSKDGETANEAKRRYEAEHGPLGNGLALVWQQAEEPACA